MAKKSKPVTPAQSKRIASKLLELDGAIRDAQRAYQRTHEVVHKLSGDVETHRLALESFQSSYLIEFGKSRDFENYEKARRKLSRVESAYAAADEKFQSAQRAYDKSKGAKNTKNLQDAREALDKIKPKINSATAEFFEAVGKISEIANMKKTSPQLEKALKDYSAAVEKQQNALPKLQKARTDLQRAWDEQAQYLTSLRRKKTQF